MNKEINTIIANLEGCIGMFDYLLTPTESNLLVSYIEELQQENKLLKEKYLNSVADYEYEKCKNQKAIKHLEEHYSDFPDGMKENYDEETIKILKGE